MDKTWYNSLKKSKLTPPPYVFSIIWTILYIMIIISFFVYKSGKISNEGIYYFYVQIILNLIWIPIFFKLKNPYLSLIVVILLWIYIYKTINIMNMTNRLAGYLLYPYLLWISIACYFNFHIVLYN